MEFTINKIRNKDLKKEVNNLNPIEIELESAIDDTEDDSKKTYNKKYLL